MEALSYRGVCKSFGEVQAVKPLDLDIPAGDIFGLLGPNGAGKTTLIRMTLRIILPDAGSVEVFGRRAEGDGNSTFGYLPEERGLYPKMKVQELLEFFARLRGLSAAEARSRARAGLERVGLPEWGPRKVEELSKGMQQKVQLLVALLHRPKVAILDEPFSGLDPVNVEMFYEIIREATREGTTVVLSTHQMEQVEQLCRNIALINKGEVVLRGEVDAIRRQYGARDVSVDFSDGLPPVSELGSLVEDARTDVHSARFTLREGVKPREILSELLAKGCDVTRFEEAQASMHDIFVRVVTRGEGASHAG